MALPAGWYPVANDPPGTHRYWDGERFTTAPQRNPNARVTGTRSAAVIGEREIAGLVNRAFAFLIDALAPGVILAGLANATGWGLGHPENFGQLDYRSFYIALAVFAVLNHVVLGGLTGQTLGKATLGLRIVRSDTRRAPGVPRALLRHLVWAFPLTILINPVMMILGPRRTLNDVVAGTVVVYA
jgi:uncharacterized RDD family membrane protein YckC